MSIKAIEFENDSWFKITNTESLRPFLMSIVSDSNHWMFISSNGGLTAGRRNAEYSLFPYYTDDKLTRMAEYTGSKSILSVDKDNETFIWEPFSIRSEGVFEITRNIYKNKLGNKIMFEEVNHDLSLTFRYQWNSSEKFGFVKKSRVTNSGSDEVILTFVDGIQNVLPASVNADLQNRSSNLLDAYKRTELIKETGLGIFALSAIPVDKAEPSEALKANIVWSVGVDSPFYLLSSLQLDSFRNRIQLKEELDVKGEKGAYFIKSEIKIAPQEEKEWWFIANVNLNHSQVVALNHSLKHKTDLKSEITEDINIGSRNLKALIAAADGLQLSNDPLKDARHFSNTMFNIMRGGTFDNNYQIEKNDFLSYLKNASKSVFDSNSQFINALNDEFSKFELDELLTHVTDADFIRLSKEYLPIKFSRRHGDPSRPWNIFSINTHNEDDGSKILDYEGNWRDIFQNWEALAHSYPHFIDGMIFKFLNATTFEGYNPYRVTKGGFDWEIIEPDDPWSYIGYWGDHQIIYLLKFLEFYQNQKSDALKQWFNAKLFVYANVPYRIKCYEDITQNPKDTIDFDFQLDKSIHEQVEHEGADGALLKNRLNKIHHVNLIEKILATVLAKVSNLVPEAGIWMNTQRPEWNDANNALVGNGASMVTLYYLRRFLHFFEPLIENSATETLEISVELKEFFETVLTTLNEKSGFLKDSLTNKARRDFTDALGTAASVYRERIYKSGFNGKYSPISTDQISEFIRVTKHILEHSIRVNKRSDKLYHAYNIISIEDDEISVSHLEEMLEGQVAVLSAGLLSSEESLEILDALKTSSLFREDQHSYILYPNKNLPGFITKNTIPQQLVSSSELLKTLVAKGNESIISKDIEGAFHFNSNFKNANDLITALGALEETEYNELVESEKSLILRLYEEVFNHKAFTGRSGTFFGYEGLGSIYWHMVSKLHLAVYEVCKKAYEERAPRDIQNRLAIHFDEIATGIGVHKSPELYGAFPTDAYSHTPAHKGAQQPGMTGQVKEDILTRSGELGIELKNGLLSFDPFLLKKNEFTNQKESFELLSLNDEHATVNLEKASIGFTYCQVPVLYKMAANSGIEVVFADETVKVFEEPTVNNEITESILARTGNVKKINVLVDQNKLR